MMTTQRIKDAAQILGEFGNGKMANELMELSEVAEPLLSVAKHALVELKGVDGATVTRKMLRAVIAKAERAQ